VVKLFVCKESEGKLTLHFFFASLDFRAVTLVFFGGFIMKYFLSAIVLASTMNVSAFSAPSVNATKIQKSMDHDEVAPLSKVGPQAVYQPGQRLTFFNSVKNDAGAGAVGYNNPVTFWQIPYAARFQKKGVVSNATTNYYNPTLYSHPQVFQPGKVTKFVDEIWDLENHRIVILVATATGVNKETMRMENPVFVSGSEKVFNAHFAGGWATYDRDEDLNAETCTYRGIMQYIGFKDASGCSAIHLAGWPYGNEDYWGPTLHPSEAIPEGEVFHGDSPVLSKINRYRRSIYIPQ
jgi:hypothetical protein